MIVAVTSENKTRYRDIRSIVRDVDWRFKPFAGGGCNTLPLPFETNGCCTHVAASRGSPVSLGVSVAEVTLGGVCVPGCALPGCALQTCPRALLGRASHGDRRVSVAVGIAVLLRREWRSSTNGTVRSTPPNR